MPFNYETQMLPENGIVKLVVHENGIIDVTHGNLTTSIKYYKQILTGTETLELKLSEKIYLNRNDDNYIRIGSLYLVDGMLKTTQTTYHGDLGVIPNHYIVFVR